MSVSWSVASNTVRQRARLVLAVVVVLTVVLGVGLTKLEFKTSQDALIDPSSQVYKDNARYQAAFGGETMAIAWTGSNVADLFTPKNLAALRAIEADLRASGAFSSVIGPATVMDFAAAQITVAPGMATAAIGRLPAAMQPIALQIAQQQIQAEGARFAAVGTPTLDNPKFADFLLRDASGAMRSGLTSIFPDEQHALLGAQLKGNASLDVQGVAPKLVDQAVAAHPLDGFTPLTAGAPELLDEIDSYLRGGMALLGAIAVGVMMLLLLVVFRVRYRLLPLAVVVVGTVWAFGAIGLLDVPLSMVTISGLPIFIGLGVDFAIQMHNRYDEEIGRGLTASDALERTFAHMAPPLIVAMVAAVAGFLALQMSDVPMIRDFGVMLCIGVLALVVSAVVLPVTILFARTPESGTTAPRHLTQREGVIERGVRRLVSTPRRALVPLLIISVGAIAAGLVTESKIATQTDPEKWVSQDTQATRDIHQLTAIVGYSSGLDLLIEAPDVTTNEFAAWTHKVSKELPRRYPVLLTGNSLANAAAAVYADATAPVASDLLTVLQIAPPDLARTWISDDRTVASLSFSARDMTLAQRDTLVRSINADLRGDLAPPAGGRATPAGLAVVGAELVRGLDSTRGTLTLLSIGLVFLWLIVSYRSFTRALLPLLPVVIAVGASTFGIYILGIELTPLTTIAGPLVIAVSTEFAVLLEARYVEERQAGRAPSDVVASGLPRIGRAFVASGLTLLGGFAVLASSELPLLRDFGIVVSLDVAIALVTSLVVLPPLLVWGDQSRWVRGHRFATVVPDADSAMEPQPALAEDVRQEQPTGA